MKFRFASLGLTLLIAVGVRAQGTFANPSLEQLRDDYNASTLVVRVTLKNTSVPSDDDHYYQCIVHGKFADAFKGKIHKGEPIDFFVRAKDGCDVTLHKGDRFVFLLRRFNRQINAWVYEQWSIHPFSKQTLANLRKLRKTGGA